MSPIFMGCGGNSEVVQVILAVVETLVEEEAMGVEAEVVAAEVVMVDIMDVEVILPTAVEGAMETRR